ncbi:DDE-type integrase/transposase/recombinase, partial [Brucella haematophila]
AVDQHGSVLEEILQKRRDKRAAKRLLVALMSERDEHPTFSFVNDAAR